MKNLWVCFALLLAVSCGQRMGDGIRTLRVTENTEADFGTIREIDGPATIRLLVRNDLADTLFPVQYYTHCGCTRVDQDRAPVPPGADEVITVTYNPAYRPGIFMQEVQIYYQDSPVKMRSFLVKGEVIGCTHPIEEDRPYHMGKGLYMSHKVLAFGNKAPGETGDIFFRHGNGGTKKAVITFDIPEEWQPWLRMRQPGRMKADERDTIHVKFTMPDDIDTVRFDVQPRVNGVPTEEVLHIRANRKRP